MNAETENVPKQGFSELKEIQDPPLDGIGVPILHTTVISVLIGVSFLLFMACKP